jgi:acyl-CoA dehydrogenase
VDVLDRQTIGLSFELSDKQKALQRAAADFVQREVIPHETTLLKADSTPWSLIQTLREMARNAGLYGPHIHPEWGGMGADWRTVAIVFEEIGTSLLGPLAINGAAPDEGNMHLLQHVASPAQRDRYLGPLARGEIRSCFAMTEPAPGAGSDPAQLSTRAHREGNEWALDGRKWYATGAKGAAFAIVMARNEAEGGVPAGATMFLVPSDTPGLSLVRELTGLGSAFLGGHGELQLTGVRVPDDAVLGEVGRGFEYAQLRLAPARLTHCMRWLGVARRSLEIATEWATQRSSGGSLLGEHQMVQAMLADSAIELHAARLMIWHAAWTLDQGRPAREESSLAKVFVSEVTGRVVDRAVQICGALGMSDDTPLSLFYREIRPFRIYDGPSEVHRASIARRMLRRARNSG